MSNTMLRFIWVSDFRARVLIIVEISQMKMGENDTSNEKIQTNSFLFFTLYMSLWVRKPTIWVLTRSDTNWPVQSQKQARSLKFRI